MRKTPASLLAALFVLSLASAPAWSGVFISELCDPQSNFTTDRYIEIYNPGPGTVDLTGWRIVAIGNGVDVNTWTLSGSIAAGEAKVAGSTAPATVFPIHFASSSWLTNYFNWNGQINDGAKLYDNSNVLLDSLKMPTDEIFRDKTLVRIPSVTEGSLGYVAVQWVGTPVATAPQATPGSHNGSTPPAGGPVIANIVTDPASPTAGVPVDVQATVIDTSGAIEGVTLTWGTSAGSQPNVIGMPLLSGDTYRTSGQIPGQISGATIYYRVSAEGASATSQSTLRNYLIPGGGTGVPPSVLAVGEMSDSTFLVFFSEPVDSTSARVPTNYVIGALVAVDAVYAATQPSQVLVTIRGVAAGTRTLTVNGVGDLEGNFAANAMRSFNYVNVAIPAGYYNGTEGLSGVALRAALQDILSPHNVGSYSGALTAFQTTDVKPNGKVWDMYSDIPGGTPPYEYTFGQGAGGGGTEGLGYNREHSWPDSWFNGGSPMHTDLWILYPTDTRVNGYRAAYPYGEVAAPSVTSWNGSKLGSSASPGYMSTVFEPIDEYKGDLARGQFYVATRYYGQDGSWGGGGSASGANILQWAVSQYSQWSSDDPVSWKERMRNGAVYVIQGNRNPFVDHPEFVTLIYDSASVIGVGDGAIAAGTAIRLRANVPNPFTTNTAIVFDLARPGTVTLRVFDVAGRLVRELTDGAVMDAGSHRVDWNGADDSGARVGAGLYFCQVQAGADRATRRVVLAK